MGVITLSRMNRRAAPDADAYVAAIAAEVRAAMARQRIQQKELGERLGWPRNYMNKRYNGKTPFSIPDLTAVCDELGIDMAALIGRAKRIARDNGHRQAG